MIKSQLLAISIKKTQEKLTKSERLVSEYVLNNYPHSVFGSASEISRASKVSKATVGRFVKKLGFKSFEDYQYQIREEMRFLTSSPAERWEKTSGRTYSIGDLRDLEIENIKRTLDELDESQLTGLVREMTKPNRKVFIMGERKNWPMAFLLYAQLNWILPSVHLLSSTGSFLPDYLLDIGPEDVLIVFCFRRYPRVEHQFVSALRYRYNGGGIVALITDSTLCPISPQADYRFFVQTEGLSLFDSYTATATLINVILLEVLKESPESATERSRAIEYLFDLFHIYSRLPGMADVDYFQNK